jgi:hypothetical protein
MGTRYSAPGVDAKAQPFDQYRTIAARYLLRLVTSFEASPGQNAMKTLLAVTLCMLPFALVPAAYAQGNGANPAAGCGKGPAIPCPGVGPTGGPPVYGGPAAGLGGNPGGTTAGPNSARVRPPSSGTYGKSQSRSDNGGSAGTDGVNSGIRGRMNDNSTIRGNGASVLPNSNTSPMGTAPTGPGAGIP